MDIRLENEYKKKDVGKQTSDKIELPVSVPFPVKIERFQKVSEKGEIKTLFEKWETYVIPFTAARIAEGLTFFTIMRTFQDIFGLTDIFFLLSAIALFGCCCMGAVVAKYFNAVVNDPEALDVKNYLNPSVNKKFFKELELDILGYQVYGYFQTYIMIMGCWYLQPNIIFETALYGFSRVIGVITSQPIYWVGRYAKDYNYDYVKTLQFLLKKIGPLGLLAGARDNCVIEIVVAIILIPLEYLFRFIL